MLWLRPWPAVPVSNHRYLRQRLPDGSRHRLVDGRSRVSMRAVTYPRFGDASVLQLVAKPVPEPGDGEVRVRVLVSGVNPTDWKSRSGAFGATLSEPTVPNHDGAGVVDEVGAGVGGFGVGDRVWVTLAGDGRPAGGTAQEFTVVPAERVFGLPAGAGFELGAS